MKLQSELKLILPEAIEYCMKSGVDQAFCITGLMGKEHAPHISKAKPQSAVK